MSQVILERPASGEGAPYYFDLYIPRVPGGNILDTLEREGATTLKLLRSIPESRADFRYAPGKWSLVESWGHVNDTERIFALRGLWFARDSPSPMPGYDQDAFVEAGGIQGRSLGSVVEEFEAIRRSTLTFYRGLPEPAWMRRGTANNFEMTVRTTAWVIAGHELHHRQLLQEKYL